MRTRLLLLLVVLSLTAVAPPASSSAGCAADGGCMADTAMALGLRACAPGETSTATPPVVAFVSCSGEMRTFDGLELDARLTFPAGATGPVPVVLLLHAWPGDRRAWQPAVDRTDVLGRGRFLAEGYAVLATTARGLWASCSTLDPVADANAAGSTTPGEEDPAGCARGWTHIAERDVEGRDSQHLLGQLVDAGIADPDRLAVLGDSYGGGQAWLLATSLPWQTPGGTTIRLAAAVARQGWTDLLDALAPSGRDDRPRPLGVLKASTFANLWGLGRVQPWYLPGYPQGNVEGIARYNTVEPSEGHSFIDGWMAVFNAGEPYDAAAADYMEAALAGKSAMYAEGFFAAVAAGQLEPTPVMALQGWTDTLFGPAQTVRMYQRLKGLDDDYPVHIAFADGGHGSLPRPAQWAVLDELGARFIVEHLSGGPVRTPPVTSLRASCEAGQAELAAASADDWAGLARSSVVLAGTGSATTSSLTPDPEVERTLDPVSSGFRACTTVDRAPSGSARWSWDVPDGDLETVGLQQVSVDYALTGVDATLIARVWELDPAGRRTLVTSGVRRIATRAGDAGVGTVELSLFGTHWRFREGRRIELELSQTDAPYLRPDTTPSSLVLTTPRLVLPVR